MSVISPIMETSRLIILSGEELSQFRKECPAPIPEDAQTIYGVLLETDPLLHREWFSDREAARATMIERPGYDDKDRMIAYLQFALVEVHKDSLRWMESALKQANAL